MNYVLDAGNPETGQFDGKWNIPSQNKCMKRSYQVSIIQVASHPNPSKRHTPNASGHHGQRSYKQYFKRETRVRELCVGTQSGPEITKRNPYALSSSFQSADVAISGRRSNGQRGVQWEVEAFVVPIPSCSPCMLCGCVSVCLSQHKFSLDKYSLEEIRAHGPVSAVAM